MERLVEEKERGQRKEDEGEWLTSPPTVGGRICPSPEEKHVLFAVYIGNVRVSSLQSASTY